MKVFTEEEVNKLIADKRISPKDALRLAFTAKEAMSEDDDKPEKDILEDIRDCLTQMVEIGRKEADKEEKIVVQAAAPVVNVASPSDPQVTINHPLPTSWTTEITERDGRGYIKKLVFSPGGAA